MEKIERSGDLVYINILMERSEYEQLIAAESTITHKSPKLWEHYLRLFLALKSAVKADRVELAVSEKRRMYKPSK